VASCVTGDVDRCPRGNREAEAGAVLWDGEQSKLVTRNTLGTGVEYDKKLN